MLNPFVSDAFGLISLTQAINIFPNQYGLLEKLGLFTERGTRTRTALIERRNGVLNLLPSQPLGAPPTVGKNALRDVLTFPIPHIPHEDAVLPGEVQGLRAFGQENDLETVSNVMLTKLENMRNKHAITLEFLRMGALNGQVIDGDGTTVLANLYTAWGISQQVQNSQFTNAALNVAGQVLNIRRYMEDNLKGETMTGVMVLCSGGFYDAFTSHAKVSTAYQFWMGMQDKNPLRDDLRYTGFTFQGVTFMEYRGHASTFSGTDIPFIPANCAFAFPLGTTSMFQTYFAPAEFNETVNTLGLPMYAKQEERKFGMGWDIWTESNPLPMVTRPDLLVKLTIS